MRRHYNGETFDTAEIHTGGGGDIGIDAVAVLVNGSLVTDVESLDDHADLSGHFDVTFVFVQADRGSSFEGKKINEFAFGVKDFFDPHPKLTRNAEISAAAEIMDRLYQSGTKFDPGIRSAGSIMRLPGLGRAKAIWRAADGKWRTTSRRCRFSAT